MKAFLKSKKYCHLPTDDIFLNIGGRKSGGEASLIGRMENLKYFKGIIMPRVRRIKK